MSDELRVMVSFCCNDERGNIARHVTAIHLPDGMLDIETIAIEGVGFREVRPHQIRISRRTFPVYGYRPMYGNVFWNGYEMAGRDVLRLLVWARESGKFQADGGWAEICDWWDRQSGFDEWPWFLKQLRKAA